MTEQEKYNRFLELLSRTDRLTDEEISEVVIVWADPTNTNGLPAHHWDVPRSDGMGVDSVPQNVRQGKQRSCSSDKQAH